MTVLQQLNPRLHVAAAIGWAVFVVVTLVALIAANLAATEAERQARTDAEGLLAELATQVRDALAMNLETRRSLLLATAAEISASAHNQPEAMRLTLDAVKNQFPELAWLGVVDEQGRVLVGTQDQRVGEDVSATAWFQRSRQGAFVSDLHARQRPADGFSAGAGESRSLEFAVPFNPLKGRDASVVAAQLSWSWVERILSKMQEALSKRRQLEVMLAGRDGTVLVGPPAWQGRQLAPADDITEGGSYVVGTRTQLRLADGLGLGWSAIVRQSADAALAPARNTGRAVFLIVFLAGALSACAAALVARALTGRLSRLAVEAEEIRRGERRTLDAPPGADEVSRIGATLAEVVDNLQTEKAALLGLNAELDQRVADRTLRIERMADEARLAAVTRERLRLARDLHDTLAHSLMALLTQIRLIRKLRARMDGNELDAELGRAEGVAASGLGEARAAIMQMRDNGVRDTGLGPAVQDLAKRFGQRTGLVVSFEADPRAASWADDRAETVFRIIEEALRNVERHAQPRGVRIALTCGQPSEAGIDGSTPGTTVPVLVEVADDGVGFDPIAPWSGHYGLRGMREQAALIGAQLGIDSGIGRGTRILLRLDS